MVGFVRQTVQHFTTYSSLGYDTYSKNGCPVHFFPCARQILLPLTTNSKSLWEKWLQSCFIFLCIVRYPSILLRHCMGVGGTIKGHQFTSGLQQYPYNNSRISNGLALCTCLGQQGCLPIHKTSKTILFPSFLVILTFSALLSNSIAN